MIKTPFDFFRKGKRISKFSNGLIYNFKIGTKKANWKSVKKIPNIYIHFLKGHLKVLKEFYVLKLI